jgi:peroxiredoxin family protein/sulfur relay (sulfurtransferase) DsrC/TusE family protein
MSTTQIAGREVHVDAEGFMTDPSEWTENRRDARQPRADDDPDHWLVIGICTDLPPKADRNPAAHLVECRATSGCSSCSRRSGRRWHTSPAAGQGLHLAAERSHHMTTEPTVHPSWRRGDRICFICSKGNLDMAYPALIMANGAVGEGIETHIFFTFWGGHDQQETMHDLKFTLMGNTAIIRRDASGSRCPRAWAAAGMTKMATKMLKKQIADQGVPEVPEFLDLLVESGAKLWACKMSVDMMGLTKEDMHDGVVDIINVTSFLELAEGAQVIFV